MTVWLAAPGGYGNMKNQTMNKRGNRIEYDLTEREAAIIEWIRRNSNGRDWIGTIRYVSGVNVYQLFDARPAGRVGRN